MEAMEDTREWSGKRKQSAGFPTKIKLYKSLVLSILLNGCESCTLTAELEMRIQAFENKCNRMMHGMSNKEHKTNEYVWQQVNMFSVLVAGRHELLLSTAMRRKFHGSVVSAITIRCQRS